MSLKILSYPKEPSRQLIKTYKLIKSFNFSQRRQHSHNRSGIWFENRIDWWEKYKIASLGHRFVKNHWSHKKFSNFFNILAGQERFRSVTRSYYRGAAGALLVYDVTSRESFNSLTNWLNDTRTLASPHIVILLVGNKRDLEEEREVTFLEASTFAQENDLIFLETSAKSGENVEESFLKVSKTILAKIETGEINPDDVGSGIQFSEQLIKNKIQNSQRSGKLCTGSNCRT